MNKTGLSYETYVSGRPILFLHGFGVTSYTWHRLIPLLPHGYRSFLIDLKGSGSSPRPRDGKYSVHDQAELVYNFILENHLENVTLVGNSFGGGIALVTAKLLEEKPGLLSSLILIDSAAYAQNLPSFIRLLRTPILGILSQYVLPARYQIISALRFAYYDPAKISESSVDTYAESLRLPGGRYALRQTARQIVPPDLDEIVSQYKNIDVPTLIIWGRHDNIVPRWVGEKLKEDLPNSKLIIIENAGHMPQEETPEAVVPIISSFLELIQK